MKSKLKYIIGGLIGLRSVYALTLTAWQYFVWKSDPVIGQLLLPPHQPIAYFLRYSWTHFLFNAVLSVGMAYVFYFILRAIKKHRAEIFEEGEPELGLACALMLGWPNIVLFVPLAFLLLLIFSSFRRVFLKEEFTTITLPMLVSLPIILLWGNKALEIFKLTALQI